jgi:hypothetical protein
MCEELTWMTPGSASVLMSPRSVSSLAIFFRTRRMIFPDLEIRIIKCSHPSSVGDPDVFGPSGPGSISQRYGSGSGAGFESFPYLMKGLSGLK